MKTTKSLYSRLALITSVTLVVGYFVVYAVYENINSEEVASNATITSTLMTKIKNNLEYLSGGLANFTFSSGNVGIGVSPSAKLQVNGDIKSINTPKVWVNFDGASCSPNCTIRASYNVSSVVKNSVWNYTINFTNPLIDTNYVALPEPLMDSNDATVRQFGAYLKNTNSVKVRHIYADGGWFHWVYDYNQNGVVIFWN